MHKRRLQRFLASPLFSFSPCLYHLTPVVDSWSPPRSRCGRHMCMAPSGVISGLHLSFHTWGKDEGGAPRSIVLSKREKRNFRIPMGGGENERERESRELIHAEFELMLGLEQFPASSKHFSFQCHIKLQINRCDFFLCLSSCQYM